MGFDVVAQAGLEGVAKNSRRNGRSSLIKILVSGPMSANMGQLKDWFGTWQWRGHEPLLPDGAPS